MTAKKPKLATMKVQLEQSVAIRIIEMFPISPGRWRCASASTPWVVRPEALVAILDVKEEEEATESCTVQLTEESGQLIVNCQDAPTWWPLPEGSKDKSACLYVQKRGRKRKAATKAVTKKIVKKARKMIGKKAKGSASTKTKKKTAEQTKAKSPKKAGKAVKKSENIEFTVKNLTRSKRGFRVIQRMMAKIKVSDATAFSLFDLDSGKCKLGTQTCQGILWQQFLDAAPKYFVYRPGVVKD